MKNMTNQGCPSALELFEFINSRLPESQANDLKEHVENCTHCSQTISNLKDYMMQSEDYSKDIHEEYEVPDSIVLNAKQPTRRIFESIRNDLKTELSFGQLWSTRIAEQSFSAEESLKSRIVVVLDNDFIGNSPLESVVVAPISLELEYLSQFDYCIFEDESNLGYDFMIEVWNQTTTLVSQLKSCLDTLPNTLQENLRLLNQVYLGSEGDLSGLVDRIGWPILHENDPRTIFQRNEVEECSYLREPALREITLVEQIPSETYKERFNIWFSRNNGTLLFSEVESQELEALAVAATNRGPRDWFLYAKNKVAGEEIIAKFTFHLIQRELRMFFEKLPKTIECNYILITGYGKARVKLFSETVKAKQGNSFVVSKNKDVLPDNIEELNVTSGTNK